ncbi:hypothetical protein L345_10296, partial [Ophiophagus hannah]
MDCETIQVFFFPLFQLGREGGRDFNWKVLSSLREEPQFSDLRHAFSRFNIHTLELNGHVFLKGPSTREHGEDASLSKKTPVDAMPISLLPEEELCLRKKLGEGGGGGGGGRRRKRGGEEEEEDRGKKRKEKEEGGEKEEEKGGGGGREGGREEEKGGGGREGGGGGRRREGGEGRRIEEEKEGGGKRGGGREGGTEEEEGGGEGRRRKGEEGGREKEGGKRRREGGGENECVIGTASLQKSWQGAGLEDLPRSSSQPCSSRRPSTIPDKCLSRLFLKASSDGAPTTSEGNFCSTDFSDTAHPSKANEGLLITSGFSIFHLLGFSCHRTNPGLLAKPLMWEALKRDLNNMRTRDKKRQKMLRAGQQLRRSRERERDGPADIDRLDSIIMNRRSFKYFGSVETVHESCDSSGGFGNLLTTAKHEKRRERERERKRELDNREGGRERETEMNEGWGCDSSAVKDAQLVSHKADSLSSRSERHASHPHLSSCPPSHSKTCRPDPVGQMTTENVFRQCWLPRLRELSSVRPTVGHNCLFTESLPPITCCHQESFEKDANPHHPKFKKQPWQKELRLAPPKSMRLCPLSLQTPPSLPKHFLPKIKSQTRTESCRSHTDIHPAATQRGRKKFTERSNLELRRNFLTAFKKSLDIHLSEMVQGHLLEQGLD